MDGMGSFNNIDFERPDIDQMLKWGRLIVPKGATVVLPFSGGLDSATIAAYLAMLTEPQKVIAIHIGHSTTQPQETVNARKVANSLGINFMEVDLHDVQMRFTKIILENSRNQSHSGTTLTVTSNASMVYLYAREYTRRVGGFLAGTLDLSEILTGYFPKECFGGDFQPIGGMFRNEVRELASILKLPPLPEQFAVVPGCGSIVDYVNSLSNTNFENEYALDLALLREFREDKTSELLSRHLTNMRHKSIYTLRGRPVYTTEGRGELLNEAFGCIARL